MVDDLAQGTEFPPRCASVAGCAGRIISWRFWSFPDPPILIYPRRATHLGEKCESITCLINLRKTNLQLECMRFKRCQRILVQYSSERKGKETSEEKQANTHDLLCRTTCSVPSFGINPSENKICLMTFRDLTEFVLQCLRHTVHQTSINTPDMMVPRKNSNQIIRRHETNCSNSGRRGPELSSEVKCHRAIFTNSIENSELQHLKAQLKSVIEVYPQS